MADIEKDSKNRIGSFESLLRELEEIGDRTDRATNERSKRLLNITRDTGELLAVLIRATRAVRVLEIGTSNGYSTLWLAEAASAIGGHVTSIEQSDYKVGLARANFAKSGLAGYISLLHEDAGGFLSKTEASSFDLIFLDSDRAEYKTWWPEIRRALRPGGLLVVDNAISHAAEMMPFVGLLQSDPRFTWSLVPVGKGELLAVKAAAISSTDEANEAK